MYPHPISHKSQIIFCISSNIFCHKIRKATCIAILLVGTKLHSNAHCQKHVPRSFYRSHISPMRNLWLSARTQRRYALIYQYSHALTLTDSDNSEHVLWMKTRKVICGNKLHCHLFCWCMCTRAQENSSDTFINKRNSELIMDIEDEDAGKKLKNISYSKIK